MFLISRFADIIAPDGDGGIALGEYITTNPHRLVTDGIGFITEHYSLSDWITVATTSVIFFRFSFIPYHDIVVTFTSTGTRNRITIYHGITIYFDVFIIVASLSRCCPSGIRKQHQTADQHVEQ